MSKIYDEIYYVQLVRNRLSASVRSVVGHTVIIRSGYGSRTYVSGVYRLSKYLKRCKDKINNERYCNITKLFSCCLH